MGKKVYVKRSIRKGKVVKPHYRTVETTTNTKGTELVERIRTKLEQAVDDATKPLQAYSSTHRGSMGLVPTTPEYKKLKSTFDSAFKKLQQFNKENKPAKRTGYNIKPQ